MKVQALIAALALSVGTLALAQTAPAPAGGASTPGIDKRVANQQKRIDQGVASGQLTAKETNTLDKKEAKLAADTQAAKADGKVTKAERRKLKREANQDSKAIHQKKHNKRKAASAPQ